MEESKVHELFEVPIDFEKLSFISKNMNPYETAVATARYARSLNDRVRKYYGPEVNIHPRNIAVRKMTEKGTHVVYKDQPKEIQPKVVAEKPKEAETTSES
jgi:DNA-directed RNA polymerase subunit K/omega